MAYLRSHPWLWFWAAAAIASGYVAWRFTPELLRKLKTASNRAERIAIGWNLWWAWAPVILTTMAGLSTQLGSHKAETTARAATNEVTTLKASLIAASNHIADLEAAVRPGPLPVRILRVLQKINPQTEELLRAHPEGLFANGPILEARADELAVLAEEDFTETYFRFSRSTEEPGMSTKGLVIPVQMKLKPALTNWFGYEKGLKRSTAGSTSADPK